MLQRNQETGETGTDARRIMVSDLVKFLPLCGLVMLGIFFQITSGGKLLTAQNLKLVFVQSYALFLAAVAGVFVVATDNLDFSMGANLGFTSACACLVAFVDVRLALPVAILVGVVVGIANGVVHVIFKLPSFIVSLCMMFILTAATQSMTKGTSIMMPVEMMSFDNTLMKIVVFVVYLVLMVTLFEYTKVGKQLKAIGISPEAATQSGVDNGKMKILAYVITGAASGLAGFFTLIRSGAASPANGQTMTTDVIIAIVLGGMSISGGATSKISAALIGTLVITVLGNGMVLSGMGGDAQQLIKGLIFIAVVAVSARSEKNAIVK
jgi:ribose transport system permease protein